jgi:peptide/nickel transport system substrate-binding protein
MPSRLHAITLALAAITACAACAARDRRTPDDTLVVLTDTPITTADPRFASTNYDSKLVRLVAPGLTAIDTPNLEPRLALAAAIDHVDPLTVDVTLRADARFSDGTPVTPADVVALYGSVLDPRSPSQAHKQLAERYAAVEACGARCVRFHLRTTLATLMTDLDFGILKAGADHVVGAGPYALRELTDTTAYLDANPYYYGAAPRTPHVEIRYVADASARILMLVGGSADLIQNAVRPDLVDDVAERPRVRVQSAPSVILTFMMLNTEDPLLRDVRVRQAIALAVDRPAIIAGKLSGRAVLATGLLAPTHWAYSGDVPHWNRDLPRARALLDAAGLVPDAHGIRAHLVYKTSSDAFRVAVARVLAAQLGEVGIEVEVRAFEFATFFADVKRGNFQIATMQTAEISDPDYYFPYFNSERIPSAADPDANNRTRYRNADVDRLTTAGRSELDPVKRKAIYAEVQRIVAEDVPVVPLWHEDVVVLENTSVEGYRIVPDARLPGLVTAVKRVETP